MTTPARRPVRHHPSGGAVPRIPLQFRQQFLFTAQRVWSDSLQRLSAGSQSKATNDTQRSRGRPHAGALQPRAAANSITASSSQVLEHDNKQVHRGPRPPHHPKRWRLASREPVSARQLVFKTRVLMQTRERELTRTRPSLSKLARAPSPTSALASPAAKQTPDTRRLWPSTRSGCASTLLHLPQDDLPRHCAAPQHAVRVVHPALGESLATDSGDVHVALRKTPFQDRKLDEGWC
eukprot:2831330-Rhodomonas_salina.5